MAEKITVSTTVNAPIEKVWACWTEPQHITQWNAASDDWHTPTATNDLRIGGTFSFRMEARDKSQGFDMGGTYTDVVPHKHIAYTFGDGRAIDVTFEETSKGIHITETFDAENENSIEMQRNGWQAIMDRFKAYVETLPA